MFLKKVYFYSPLGNRNVIILFMLRLLVDLLYCIGGEKFGRRRKKKFDLGVGFFFFSYLHVRREIHRKKHLMLLKMTRFTLETQSPANSLVNGTLHPPE